MKLFPLFSPATFETPSARTWLAFFLCGFLTAWLLGPLLYAGLWLIGLAAVAMKVPAHPVILDVSIASAARVILWVSVGFGSILATMMKHDLRQRKRREIVVP